jgi:hypothetical protein
MAYSWAKRPGANHAPRLVLPMYDRKLKREPFIAICRRPSRASRSRGAIKNFVPRLRESQLDAFPTGGIVLGGLGKRRPGAMVSLVITLHLSLGAVCGLNPYLGPVEEPLARRRAV